jgi:hypothetical protein
MNEFMVHVERIVRPIVARDGRKDRMREELLAHLETHFEQNRERSADEGAARAQAIASLGDPARLRNELQDSVSKMERFKARIERLFAWHAPEPAWRYTLRAGMWTAFTFFLLLPFVVMALLPFGVEPLLAALRLLALVEVLTSFNVFVLGLFYFKIRDSILGANPHWLRPVAYVFASAATVEGTLLIFLWAATGEFVSHLSLFLGRSFVAFLLPLSGVMVAWFRGPAEIRHTLWECLDIRENSTARAVAE